MPHCTIGGGEPVVPSRETVQSTTPFGASETRRRLATIGDECPGDFGVRAAALRCVSAFIFADFCCAQMIYHSVIILYFVPQRVRLKLNTRPHSCASNFRKEAQKTNVPIPKVPPSHSHEPHMHTTTPRPGISPNSERSGNICSPAHTYWESSHVFINPGTRFGFR